MKTILRVGLWGVPRGAGASSAGVGDITRRVVAWAAKQPHGIEENYPIRIGILWEV